ncbi:hypothetical protein [Nocardiopsis trehalosi]|uniref:hypothetical protein n=1 Tax=Nocardiopsis trehalosi TaxID=109329 RepID=UPI0008357C2C|nr:hypothetical protein [Nocardiopsis trehalosi]
MLRSSSRTAVGAAAAALAFASPFGAAAASASTTDSGTQAFPYTCDDQDTADTQGVDIEFILTAPTEAEVGTAVDFSIEPTDYQYFSYVEGGDITSGTLTVETQLGGEAAPQPVVSASVEAEGSFGSDDAETWDETALAGSFTPTMPGEITLSPGDITIEIDQEVGSIDTTESSLPSTTVCSPDAATDALATVTVTGEPAVEESPSSAPAETEDGAPGQTAESENGMQGMMIFVAVAGGLMLVAAAVVLGILITVLRRR